MAGRGHTEPVVAPVGAPSLTGLPGGTPGAGQLEIITCQVPLGTTGAIATSGVDTPFCAVAKVGGKTGRYTITPTKPGVKIRYLHASIEGTADGNTPANKATVAQCRSVSGTVGTISLQIPATAGAASADAEAEDNAVLRILCALDIGKI